MKERQEQEKLDENKKQLMDGSQKNDKNNNNPLELIEDHRTRLERLIPEFYINQKTLSNESEEEVEKEVEHSDSSSDISDLAENEKYALFDRLKTKTKFFKKKNSNFLKDNSCNNKSNIELPFLPTKVNNFSKFDSQKSSVQNINKVASPGLIIKNAAASNSYRIEASPEKLVDSDPTILNIKKIREKFNVIKDMGKKKEKVLGVDLFKYDKKKWQKKNLREVSLYN